MFEDIDTAKSKLTLPTQVKNNIQLWRRELLEIADRDLLSGTTDLLTSATLAIRSWWNDSPIQEKIGEQRTKTKTAIQSALAELDRLDGFVTAIISELNTELQNKEKELREKVGTEVSKQVAIEMRARAAERLEEINKLRAEYNFEWALLQKLLGEWRNECDSLVTIQRDISTVRQKQKDEIESELNKYTTQDMAITVTFRPDGDRKSLIKYLDDSSFLSKKGLANYKASLLSWRISLFCSPVTLARSLLDNDPG